MFAAHTDWTDTGCYYAAALDGFRYALLTGPYRTRGEAEAMLPHAEAWARTESGDPNSGTYRYTVYALPTGHTRSILGEVSPPDPAAPTPFDDYVISPCRRFEEPDKPGRFFYEPCDPAEADVWMLYGHIPGQGVEAIGDFSTEAHAAEVYARITGRPHDR